MPFKPTEGIYLKLLRAYSMATFSDLQATSIKQLFEAQVAKTPDAIAIQFQGQHLTYQDLNQRANQLANYLQTQGVKTETLVGICMERSLDMFIALLGVAKSGGAYIPLDPYYPAERLAFILDDAQVAILLTQESLRENMPEHQAQVVCLDQDWQDISQQSDANLEQTIDPDQLIYLIYTSGSTGKPKGVQIRQGSLVNLLLSMQQEPGMTGSDTLLAMTTISFDLSVPDLYLPLISGAKIYLIDRDIAADAGQLAPILSEPEITFVQATPATWRLVLAAGWQGNPNLKILCGGEALTRSLANQLLERCQSLWHMYGPTETTVWSMVHQVESGDRPVPLGKAIANTQIYLVDETSRRKTDALKLAEPGGTGEIYIGGDGVARGYINRAELTAEKFIADPFAEPGSTAQLYKTGDLARLLPNGDIEMIGRIDNQVKIRGYRIELGDIETTLSQHPDIRESAVIVLDDDGGDRRLVAYVVRNSLSAELRPSQVRAWLKDKLPEYMVPSIVFFMDALPLTPNRKVDRRALPVPTIDLQEEVIAPRTLLEIQLTEIWSEVLGAEVGIYHNFFESGGDSLRTALVLAKVKAVLEVDIPLECLFKAPTIATFAEVVQAVQSGEATNFKVTPEELWADATLEESIQPIVAIASGDAAQSSSSAISTEPPRNIFLTGATGFVGVFLLQELLLKYPQSIVYCLVRADNLETASDRLRKVLNEYELWDESFGSRIIPILGDLTEPLLGLPEPQFRELADRMDIIYHSGAYVNLIYPYSALRTANVLGTQEVLRLATQSKPLPVHYISTIDVFHSELYHDRDCILETDELEDCESYTEGYAQSKWAAEKLVMAARDRGLPVSIYRLGMITGHSLKGGFQLGNVVCRMMKGFIQLGTAPSIDLKMSLAPVDYVVQAIAHLAEQSTSIGQTFHLVSPHQTTLEQLVNDLNQLGYNINTIPYSEWQAQLLIMPPDNALTPTASMFTSLPNQQYTPIETATFVYHGFDTTNTEAGLTSSNITCPTISTDTIQAYIDYFIRRKFLPRKSKANVKTSERAWVEIDLEALAHNVRQIKRVIAPTTKIMGIIKADAYGHGAIAVARTLLRQGVTDLGVATISEGVELRKGGIKANILVLGAVTTANQIRAIADWQLQPTLCSPNQALMFSSSLASAKFRGTLPVHIALDTGMSRLGASWQQVEKLARLVNHLPHLEVASVYSHLATADGPDTEMMYLQNSRFQEAIATLEASGLPMPKFHLANSAATLQDVELHYDMVRVGLSLYGLYPSPHLQHLANLKPMMQVRARITQIKTIAEGTGVSYGHQFVADRPTRIAVVGIGYADGVPRRLSGRMTVLIRGRRIQQIGAITMDQLMLDVSSIPDLKEGEIVTVIGQDGQDCISVDEWATDLDTIAWEILCGFKQRLPRITRAVVAAEGPSRFALSTEKGK
jgi:alanine racemase